MSALIRRGYQVEIQAKGFGVTKIFAESLEALDAAVAKHLATIQELRDAKSRAFMARIAGIEKKAYRAAREALSE